MELWSTETVLGEAALPEPLLLSLHSCLLLLIFSHIGLLYPPVHTYLPPLPNLAKRLLLSTSHINSPNLVSLVFCTLSYH